MRLDLIFFMRDIYIYFGFCWVVVHFLGGGGWWWIYLAGGGWWMDGGEHILVGWVVVDVGGWWHINNKY